MHGVKYTQFQTVTKNFFSNFNSENTLKFFYDLHVQVQGITMAGNIFIP